MSNLNVRRVGYAAGAEITGVDASKPLDADAVRAIREAWQQHVMVYLPRQDLDANQFRAFCGSFGELDSHNIRMLNVLPGTKEVIVRANQVLTVDGKETKKSPAADTWHSDYAYTVRPSILTYLLGKDMPSVGGDTEFANMYMAWEALSPAYQRLIEPLRAVHDFENAKATYASDIKRQVAHREHPPVVHPVVRVVPGTGKKTLFINPHFVRRFVGMSEEESKPILDFLNAHATRYEFVYRHRWQKNDLVFWDNRCSLHRALSNYDQAELRRTYRASLVGPESGVYYTDEGNMAAAAQMAMSSS